MADRVRSEGDDLSRLRRRLWVERLVSLCLLALIGALYFGLLPGGRRTTLIAVDGTPVAVAQTRGDALRLLEEVKAASGLPAEKVSFAQKVTWHDVAASKSPPQTDSEIIGALSKALQPVVSAAAIVANGEVLLALPNEAEAVRTLSLILREFSPSEPTGTVYFRESVKIETREVSPSLLYDSASAAMEKIAEDAAPRASHTVKPGDSAWKISRDYDVPMSRLAAANPELNLEQLQVGAKLRIPGELPPLTVIARRDVEMPVAPGSARMQKVRLTYENGVEVKRQVIQRAPPPPPAPRRPAPTPAQGTEGADTDPWRWRDERSAE
ncbi:MAG: LysM peptidoglycan-binding domain-containing protein [Armatimonadetes bacterium]|nr:LysM peptidoglycan-binding domain-containing protein [Armatimonadota bacterium]